MALVAIVAPANAEAPIEQQAIESPYVVAKYVKYVPPVPKIVKTVRPADWKYRCSCIEYYKLTHGIVGSLGYPNRLQPTSQTPTIGAGVLTTEGVWIRYGGRWVWSGHIAAKVLSFTETHVTFIESNYSRCGYTTRTLRRDDPRIRGYITPILLTTAQ